MKNILGICLLVLTCHCIYAQGKEPSSYKETCDSFVAKFNQGDYTGIYNLGTGDWKSKNNQDGIGGWLGYIKSQTGLVLSSALVKDSASYKYFRWDGQKKTVGFVLDASEGLQFSGFNFIRFKEPLTLEELKRVHTDNPLITSFDSAVNAITAAFMAYNKLTGVSIGVVKDGKTFAYNYGTVEKGKQQLPTANTIYELASITKTFTGILLAQAVLDKKLSLQDDITKYMDGSYPNLQFNGQPVRIVHLANHTSGLPHELPDLDSFKTSFAVLKMYDNYTNDKFLRDIQAIKLDTLPGVNYQYSNSGVKLLGIILEKVYGMSYANLVKKYILKPAGMKHTKVALPVSDTTSYTKGYDKDGNIMPHYDFNMFGGAGALLSNVNDMLLYLQQNITESNAAIKLAHQQTYGDSATGLGLCWEIDRKNKNGLKLWKGGGALGFRH